MAIVIEFVGNVNGFHVTSIDLITKEGLSTLHNTIPYLGNFTAVSPP